MAGSNFPSGFKGGVSIRGVPLTVTHPGEVFWVNGSTVLAKGAVGGSDGNDGSYHRPLATIDAAIGKCTAGRGDVIFVMPSHTETVSAAGGITCDVASVAIVGLGSGDDRPTITFTTATAADIEIDAANVTLANLRFVCDIDAAVGPIDVDAAYCQIFDCEFIDLGTDNALRWILTDANADNLHVAGCVNAGTATAGNVAFITLTGPDHVIIEDCISEGDFSAANIQVVTTAVTDAVIRNNVLENANAVDVCIEGLAASTGWIANNYCRIATDAQLTGINTPGAMSLFENYQVNADGETGKLVGTVSA